MTRTGKIARLPHQVREEVNRRLRDNVAGVKICKWLNELPAAKTVCAEFARRNGKESLINEKQLSEWRRGGFQDWLREQQVLTETREMARWSMTLAKESGGELSEGAAVLLSAQLLKLVQGFGNVHSPESAVHSRVDRSPEPRAQRNGELSNASDGPERGNIEHRISNPEHRMSEERMESEVRLLGELVKCLWGIRRGDHNRMRLAQSEKKLALRSKLAAITLERYQKEKAKEEELERQKRAAEQRRKRSPVAQLSDGGKIDLIRGKLFGPDKVVAEREMEIAEREKQTEQLRKELEVLKAEMPPSQHGQGAENGGSKVEDGGSSVKPGGADAPGAAAPSDSELMSVNPSASNHLQEKSSAAGGSGSGANFTTDSSAQSFAATNWRKDAKAQGAKKFDVDAALREVREIAKDLAELQAEFPANESSSEQLQDSESQVDPPSSENGATSSQKSSGASGSAQGPEKFDPDALLRELNEFDSEAALEKLERVNKEVAALKAERQARSSNGGKKNGESKMVDGGLPIDSGQKDASGTTGPRGSDSVARKECCTEDGGEAED